MPTITSLRWYLFFVEILGLRVVPERGELLNILGLVVLEFNVQAILNTDLHLDRVIAIWRHAVRMYPKVLLLDHFRHSSGNRDTHKIPIPIK